MLKIFMTIGLICWLISATANRFQGDYADSNMSLILALLHFIILQNEINNDPR